MTQPPYDYLTAAMSPHHDIPLATIKASVPAGERDSIQTQLDILTEDGRVIATGPKSRRKYRLAH